MTHAVFLKQAAPALACALLMSLAACAAGPAPADAVPANLNPGAQTRALATVAATGVQIYECRAEAGASAPSWAFVAPEAELFDRQGRSIGTHGAGPFWMGHDGSRVVGSVSARADAPTAGSIPWLLLATRSTGGAGVFSPVTHIQRTHTEGGAAPAGGCEARTLGQRLRVPYRADYRLFVPA